jgi:group I intron endonuclease
MEIKSGIYCIENIVNGKKYIGSSINVYKRRNRHFSELKRLIHKNIKLQRSYNKHGKENFRFYILELIENKECLIEKEQFFIDKIKPEFNINLIANSSLGVKRSEETKEKIRQANLGLKHPDWRNKLKSEAQGGDNHWTKNKKFSEESKNKMSEAQKKIYDNGYISPASKSVIELDEENNIINEWSSASKVGKYYNVSYKTITNIINGKNSNKLMNKKFKFKNGE